MEIAGFFKDLAKLVGIYIMRLDRMGKSFFC